MNFLSAAATRSPRSFQWVWPSPTGGEKLTVFTQYSLNDEEHDVFRIIALYLHFCWHEVCNNCCNRFLLSMIVLTYHAQQQVVCINWCLMQLSSLFLLKCIVFALSNGVTYTDRQGRYIWCLQLIARITYLMEISFFIFFFKMNVIMTTASKCRIIYFKYIFQSSGKSRGSWGTLQRLDSGKEM